jgi:hypothetical protein
LKKGNTMNAIKKAAFWLAVVILAGCENHLLQMRNPHAANDPGNLLALTGSVSIDGTAVVGQTLTVNTGSLDGSGTISYQWKRNGANIPGGTNPSYNLVSDDNGTVISVAVTRAGYSGSVSASAGTIGFPALTGSVSIDGSVVVGQTLTVNTTSLGGSGTISYQWKRNGADIPGGTNSSYNLVSADNGTTISVTVTRANNSGSVTSAGVGPVTLPALTGSVSITGTAVVGQTLTVNTTSLGGGGTSSYQWKRNGADIPGGTNVSYNLVSADDGTVISVTVTRAGYSGSVTSAGVGPVGTAFSVVDVGSWDTVLVAIQASPAAAFIVTVTEDLILLPQNLTAATYADKTIVVQGDNPARTITLNGAGSLFTVGADLSLELENITARGISGNNAPLVKVNTDGELVVKTGGKITGNTSNASVNSFNAGVYVGAGGRFTLDGGEISGNTNNSDEGVHGGGVMVYGGIFTMTNGTISGNRVNATNAYIADGGGVSVRSGGVFVMKGGSIENNTANSAGYSKGGGVFVESGCSFTMNGGFITGNTVSSTTNSYASDVQGGGVFYYIGATFTNSGGTVTGNWRRIAADSPVTSDIQYGSM